MTYRVRRLEPSDDRSGFRSGNVELDRFFERYAGQNQFRHHIGTTYVAVDDGDEIVGFATVAPSEVRQDHLPPALRKRLPKYPVPVLRLARLAVAERSQGKGIGRLLFAAVVRLADDLSLSVGCLGVVVDVKPDAVGFYEGLGLVRLDGVAGQLGDRPEPLPMFLELG